MRRLAVALIKTMLSYWRSIDAACDCNSPAHLRANRTKHSDTEPPIDVSTRLHSYLSIYPSVAWGLGSGLYRAYRAFSLGVQGFRV